MMLNQKNVGTVNVLFLYFDRISTFDVVVTRNNASNKNVNMETSSMIVVLIAVKNLH